jgi:hypothetical protein
MLTILLSLALISGRPTAPADTLVSCVEFTSTYTGNYPVSNANKHIQISSAEITVSPLSGITQHLSSNTHFHMFPDQDVAGESVYRKLAGITASLNICLIRHPLPSGCKDYSDYYLTQLNKHIT